MAENSTVNASGSPEKWYHKTSMIVVAFLCVGPLALPMVWFHPRYDWTRKLIGTIVMLAASWLLWVALRDAYGRLNTQMQDLQALLGQS